MFSTEDLNLLQQRGISLHTINQQLSFFKNNFPFLTIIKAATLTEGIIQPKEKEQASYLQIWENYLCKNKAVVKFVPASGAASRMFKDLFEFTESTAPIPNNKNIISFFDNISRFSFYGELNNICVVKKGKSIETLIASKEYKTVINLLLLQEGLNYGGLPKGLLLFHSYSDGTKRTPLEEHLVEGALYAKTSGKVKLHFTVSTEHRRLFEQLVSKKKSIYEKQYNTSYDVSFSEQKPSTDTIAANKNNEPFRENGNLLFRPGGHGALIENLNDIDADIIFIKNIDNVVPDSMKPITVRYKKLLAGILVDLQNKTFAYLKELESAAITEEKLKEIETFCEKSLFNQSPQCKKENIEECRAYLYAKLNRPIRVCGMVKNVGEPGGGPYLTVNKDGSVSPQILESSQINLNNPSDKAIMMNATHFNPVDLVCGVRNYKGEKFDLTQYVDPDTGFISIKSKNGKELKALELPGLWNGAMSDWNTIFAEVPIETFNPVKTVNDLLRKEHQ